MSDDIESNNSREAADNTIKHASKAAEAYSKGNIGEAVSEVGKMVKSTAEGYGHMSAGN